MINDLQLSCLNKLYWYKDQIDINEQPYFLISLKALANNLGAEGLVKEIEDYLLILTK